MTTIVLPASALGTAPGGVPLVSDLDHVVLEFTDARLSLIRLDYRPTNRWESKDQFLSVVAAQLGTVGTWQAFYDWRDREVRDAQDLRDLALECVDVRLRLGIGIEGITAEQAPHIALEDLTAARLVRQREEAKMRRAAEEQKEKQKP